MASHCAIQLPYNLANVGRDLPASSPFRIPLPFCRFTHQPGRRNLALLFTSLFTKEFTCHGSDLLYYQCHLQAVFLLGRIGTACLVYWCHLSAHLCHSGRYTKRTVYQSSSVHEKLCMSLLHAAWMKCKWSRGYGNHITKEGQQLYSSVVRINKC